MLEPPKPKFEIVRLDGRGPIIKTHNPRKTGFENGAFKGLKWGPLGGYY